MDEINRMQNFSADDIDENISEVRTARGEYESLNARISALEQAVSDLAELISGGE